MLRGLITALLGLAGIIVGDLVFRGSLLQLVRPVILTPHEQAVLTPPIAVEWDGPEEMQVWLRTSGGPGTDLGIQRAPISLTAADFPRDGGYEVVLQHPRFGGMVSASRQFRILTPTEPGNIVAPAPPPAVDITAQARSIATARATPRAARARLHQRLRVLAQENARLRSDNDRLAGEVEGLDEAEGDVAERSVETERQLAELEEEHQVLMQENARLQLHLSGVVPCSVWGYFSYPRAQFTSTPQRVLLVTDPGGNIFRNALQCEWVRQTDSTAATSCFCVGNSYGR